MLNTTVEAVLHRLEQRSRSERSRLEQLRSLGGTHLREVACELMLDVGPEVGQLLNVLVLVSGAKTIVEVGGSVGYSTLWLAEAANRTGGRVISYETEKAKQDQQRANLEAAGLLSCVELVCGDAGQPLAELAGPLDLVLLDHWKELYIREFDAAWPKLRRGGIIVADNIYQPTKNAPVIKKYLEHVQGQQGARTTIVALGDGLALTCRDE